MSLLDVQQRPAVIERINPSRYLISSPSTGNVPRSSHTLTSLQGNSGLLSGSSTAARIARKRSTQPTGYSWATYAPTTSPQSSKSTSPINPPTQTNDLVRLGTIDLKSVIHSVSVPASPVQTTIKPRKTSPPSNAITPPAGAAPSLPLLSTPSNRQQSLPAVKSTGPRFQIPITPRPGPRLPIFHPDNTTALPEISRPALLFIPNGPSPPPTRRTTRARKPAAKAMALSLGLASDGSGLDGIETPSGEHNINNSGGKGEKDRASVTSDVTPAPATPPRSHKKKVVNRDEEPAIPEAGGSEGSAPKASRRPPKRKAAAQAAEVMIVDFHNGLDQDDGSKLSVPPAKRPRRGGPDQHTATTHAPSPLSNELARAEASPPPAVPPPSVLTTSVSNPKKRKAETPDSESANADADASAASPPPAVRPKTAASSGKSKSGSNSKATQAKSKSGKESDDGSNTPGRAESTSTGAESGSEDKQMDSAPSETKNTIGKAKDKDLKEEDEDDDDDEDDDEPPRRPYNMFEEPLELKPRPRPTYKAHLKRLSTGSLGEDRPSRPRASKSKKSSSSGSSRSHSRKESEDAQQVSPTTPTTASPETDVRSSLPQATPASATNHTLMKSDAMDLDTPVPNIPQAGSAIGISVGV